MSKPIGGSSVRLAQAVSQIDIRQPVQRDAGSIHLSQNSIIDSSVHIGVRIRIIIETHGVRMPIFQDSPLNVARNSCEVLFGFRDDVIALAVDSGDFTQQRNLVLAQLRCCRRNGTTLPA
jgi:hypothetical protein